jgi:MinD-like ATPase involved in chromosome partitioning or flagellar assembly
VTDDSPQSGDDSQGHDVVDQPATELSAYPQSGEQLGGSGGDAFGYPGYADPATRSFTGFRTERRFQDPVDAGHMQPEAWSDTPPTGFPRVVHNPPPAYFGSPPGPLGPGHLGPGRLGEPLFRSAASVSPYHDLSTTALLRQVKPAPTGGWRRLLYVLSGHLINVGESPRIVRYNDLVAQANRQLPGCYRIAVLSLKGGVGKTTITATLGAIFASIRGDRVVAVDANPDRGTLSQKVPLETPATVRHLLRDAEGIQRYSDVRSYTNQGPSRLEVLASETDPAVSEAFSAEEYARTLQVLERFYSLVLTDCGTGLMHSAMSGVLAKADTLIVVSSGSVDGARSASATLDWLDAHGHEDLVRGSIAVINAVRPRSGKVDMQKVVDHFSRRCRAVRLVPFDPHLEEGAEIDLARLKWETREALIELAATVADGFPGNDRSNQRFV